MATELERHALEVWRSARCERGFRIRMDENLAARGAAEKSYRNHLLPARIYNVPVWRTRPAGGALWLEIAMCLGRWLWPLRPR
jgi:hypothetical protein